MHSHQSSIAGDEEDPLFDGGSEEDENKNNKEENKCEENTVQGDLSDASFNNSKNNDIEGDFKINIEDFASSSSNKMINKRKPRIIEELYDIGEISDLQKNTILKGTFYGLQKNLFKSILIIQAVYN